MAISPVRIIKKCREIFKCSTPCGKKEWLWTISCEHYFTSMSAGRAATTALISNDRACHLVHCYSKKLGRKVISKKLAFTSSTNREEHNNLYCLIYMFFFFPFVKIRYLNRTLEGTIANFGPFRQYSEKHLKVFFPISVGKAEKLLFRALPDLPEIQRL